MRRIIILGIVVIVVVAGWTGGWLYFSNEIRNQVALLGQNDGLNAPKVTCDNLNIAGYPFRFDLTCTGTTVVSGDLTAVLTELRGTFLVYRPNHVQVFFKAPLTLEDAFTGSQSRLDWATMDGSARVDNWRITRASLVTEGISWVDTLATEALIANAGHAEAHLIDMPDQHNPDTKKAALAGYAMVAGLTSPGLEIDAGDAKAELEITGLPDDIRRVSEPDALRQWQAAGGRMKLVDVNGSDGDNFFNITGELGLDSTGRPEGSVLVSSRGVVERFEPFIPENLRGLMLGERAEDGSYAQSIMISNGVIFAGLLPAGAVVPLY
jgi:hypothetical protein